MEEHILGWSGQAGKQRASTLPGSDGTLVFSGPRWSHCVPFHFDRFMGTPTPLHAHTLTKAPRGRMRRKFIQGPKAG